MSKTRKRHRDSFDDDDYDRFIREETKRRQRKIDVRNYEDFEDDDYDDGHYRR